MTEGQDVMHPVGLSDLCVGVCIYFCSYFHITCCLHDLAPSFLNHMLLSASVYPGDDPLQPVTSDETVSAGGTVRLTCQVAENDNSSLQWSNTAQQTLYFGEKRGKMMAQKNVLIKKAPCTVAFKL